MVSLIRSTPCGAKNKAFIRAKLCALEAAWVYSRVEEVTVSWILGSAWAYSFLRDARTAVALLCSLSLDFSGMVMVALQILGMTFRLVPPSIETSRMGTRSAAVR